MSSTITRANADAYYEGHVARDIWQDFGSEIRNRAITHATRLIADALGTTPLQTQATSDGDLPRHDVAVYEQALFMLQRTDAARDGDSGAPRYLSTSGAEKKDGNPPSHQVLAPDAVRFLREKNRPWPPIEMSRG